MRIESFDRVLLILALSLLAASACNGDDDDDEKGQEVDSQIVDNLIVENQIVGNQNAETRGTFTPEACPDDGQGGSRMDVPAAAVTALYLDAAGQVIGPFAEDLTNTENRRMCPTPPADAGPGGCSPKPPWCSTVILGQNVCIKKTPCT